MFGNSPFNQSAPKPPPKKASSYRNPWEMVSEEAKHAAKTVADVPKDIAQASVDSMWAAIYGVPEGGLHANSEKNPMKEQAQKNASTKLDFARLEQAWKQQNQQAAEHWQEKLNDDMEKVQLNAAAHSAFKAQEERAIQEIKMKEEERKKKIAEEEEMKRQQEAEEKAAMSQMADAGAAKSKAGPGGERKKASYDETAFESSKGKTGK